MKILLFSKTDKRNINILKFTPAQIIVFGFAALIIIGMLLLSLPISSRSGKGTNILDSLFTATSAVCVTGLVVVDTNTHWNSFGQTLILLLIQMGGLGIMSMATLFSLIIGRRMGLKERLTLQESLNEFTLSGVVRMIKNILIATFIIELAGAAILSARLIPIYGLRTGIAKSIFHSISAFCNAGFDTFGSSQNKFTSLSSFINDPLVVITISLLFIIGGLGFVVWRDVVMTRRFSEFMLHTKVVLLVTLVLVVVGTTLVFLFEYNNPETLKSLSFPSKVMNAYFQAVTPRTAGFNTLSMADMTEPSKFLTILLMFIGAAPGSTGGGVKVTTFSIIILAALSYVKGQEDINVFSRKVPNSILSRALTIVIISMTIIITTTMVLLLNNEGSFMQALFESTSAFGTVGLSTGITPDLNIISKCQIIITMFLGRVGPLSAAFIISSRQYNRKLSYKYPEGKINVG